MAPMLSNQTFVRAMLPTLKKNRKKPLAKRLSQV